MKRWKTVLAAAVLALAPAGAGQAQAGPCDADAALHCGDAAPGPRGVASCLKANRDQLSAECRAQVDAEQAQRAQAHRMLKACAGDAEEFCEDIDSAADRLACLQANSASLSAACLEALPPSGS